MRVIAGAARRTLLTTPAGGETRPTADRAKEGLFNILSGEIQGARFLDMFCGSGAVGIEALSRGAEKAVFVDNSPVAIKSTRENLAKTKLSDRAEILDISAQKAVAYLKNRSFDVIFLDPPYATEFSGILEDAFALLDSGGVIIAETDAKTTPPFENLLTETRVYGRTKFSFYRTGATE